MAKGASTVYPLLKSDYFRIEMELTALELYRNVKLKSDYFRIEITFRNDGSFDVER